MIREANSGMKREEMEEVSKGSKEGKYGESKREREREIERESEINRESEKKNSASSSKTQIHTHTHRESKTERGREKWIKLRSGKGTEKR